MANVFSSFTGVFKQYISLMCLLMMVACTTARGNMICYSASNKANESSATFTVYISPPDLRKSTTKAILTDMSTYAHCEGTASTEYKDALISSSLTMSSALTDLGYTGYLQQQGGNEYDAPASEVCLWPDYQCGYFGSLQDKPIYATIGIKRASGIWYGQSGVIIPSGTEIARFKTQMRYSGNWQPSYLTWVFVLNKDLVIPSYTCAITQFDKSVSLPEVTRAEISAHGAGRYPNVKKEFKFDLACEPQTAVSVTFGGTALIGTDSVLKNTLTGNGNIGVQMVFSDDTPVKLDTKYPVTASAQGNETLKLNAYYYFIGGSVSAGPIKANTTFTFDYQ